MMNKDQIHKDLSEVFRYSLNLIKLDDAMM